MALRLADYPNLEREYSPQNAPPFADVSGMGVYRRAWWVCSKDPAHQWEIRIYNRIRAYGSTGSGCPHCSGRRVRTDNNVAAVAPHLLHEWDPTNTLMPDEVAARSLKQIKWVCVQNPEHRWMATVASRTNGRGCPYCAHRKTDPTQSLAALHPLLADQWSPRNHKPPSDYLPYSSHRAWWMCPKNPEHEWDATIQSRSRLGATCPLCVNQRVGLDNNLEVKRPDLAAQWSPANVLKPAEVTYKSCECVEWICDKPGHKPWVTAVKERSGGHASGCPTCAHIVSRTETSIFELVQTQFPDAVQSDRIQIAPFELDVWIPSKQIAIEYCGIQWHREGLSARTKHHLNEKYKKCLARGIRLITIFENEWLERPESVKAYIAAILGKQSTKVGARNTALKRIPWSQARVFLDANHIQGASAPGPHCAGLFMQDELIAVMVCAIVKTRNALTDSSHDRRWELTRYCVRNGYQIVGGFQKLWRHFLKAVKPQRVVSFSNNRWSAGGIYERNGFRDVQHIGPSYWYFKVGTTKLYHKSLYQKKRIVKTLGPLLEGETEYQAMLRFGYDRIWDCGLTRWEWVQS